MTSVFEIAQVLGKLLFYIAVASLIGVFYISSLVQQHRVSSRFLIADAERRFLVIVLLLGIVGMVAFFFAQVGAFAENGFEGLFDEIYLKLMWQSSVGDAFRLRIILLVIALLATLMMVKLNNSKFAHWSLLSILIAASLGLIWSFTFVGHTVEHAGYVKLALMIHVFAMAWWMGSLWPLFNACHRLESKELHQLMHRFGQVASVMVGALMVAGLLLFYAINGLAVTSLLEPYGISFLIKLFFVCGLLLLAARHKWFLVPALKDNSQINVQKSKAKLRRSIAIEMLCAIFVLIVTSVFTTLISPVH